MVSISVDSFAVLARVRTTLDRAGSAVLYFDKAFIQRPGFTAIWNWWEHKSLVVIHLWIRQRCFGVYDQLIVSLTFFFYPGHYSRFYYQRSWSCLCVLSMVTHGEGKAWRCRILIRFLLRAWLAFWIDVISLSMALSLGIVHPGYLKLLKFYSCVSSIAMHSWSETLLWGVFRCP